MNRTQTILPRETPVMTSHHKLKREIRDVHAANLTMLIQILDRDPRSRLSCVIAEWETSL